MAAPKPRRRIVPQQVVSSPTSPAPESLQIAPQAVLVTDLRKQAELAASLLGPGRKIWVDLKPYQDSSEEVNWRKVRQLSLRCLLDLAEAAPDSMRAACLLNGALLPRRS